MKITVHGQPVREPHKEQFEHLVTKHIAQFGHAPMIVVAPNDGIPLMLTHETDTRVDYRQSSYIVTSY